MNFCQLTPNEFREKIAGLENSLKKMDAFEEKGLNEEIIRFLIILPEVFGDSLDRKTLWERIGNGLISSLAKAGDNFELFINYCLEYIKAGSGRTAANEKLSLFLESSLIRPAIWQLQFLKTIEKKHYILIVKARLEWNRRIK